MTKELGPIRLGRSSARRYCETRLWGRKLALSAAAEQVFWSQSSSISCSSSSSSSKMEALVGLFTFGERIKKGLEMSGCT